MNEKFDMLKKIIFSGDTGSGKSKLLSRITKNEFVGTTNPTIGVDFAVKTVITDDQVNIKLQIWDTAGREQFESMISNYYRGADVVVLLFDITNLNTFTKLSSKLTVAQECTGTDIPYILVGNKCDLKEKRAVTEEQAKEFAASFNAPYLEVSAKTSEGVSELQRVITQWFIKEMALCKKIQERFGDENTADIVQVLKNILLAKDTRAAYDQRKDMLHLAILNLGEFNPSLARDVLTVIPTEFGLPEFGSDIIDKIQLLERINQFEHEQEEKRSEIANGLRNIVKATDTKDAYVENKAALLRDKFDDQDLYNNAINWLEEIENVTKVTDLVSNFKISMQLTEQVEKFNSKNEDDQHMAIIVLQLRTIIQYAQYTDDKQTLRAAMIDLYEYNKALFDECVEILIGIETKLSMSNFSSEIKEAVEILAVLDQFQADQEENTHLATIIDLKKEIIRSNSYAENEWDLYEAMSCLYQDSVELFDKLQQFLKTVDLEPGANALQRIILEGEIKRFQQAHITDNYSDVARFCRYLSWVVQDANPFSKYASLKDSLTYHMFAFSKEDAATFDAAVALLSKIEHEYDLTEFGAEIVKRVTLFRKIEDFGEKQNESSVLVEAQEADDSSEEEFEDEEQYRTSFTEMMRLLKDLVTSQDMQDKYSWEEWAIQSAMLRLHRENGTLFDDVLSFLSEIEMGFDLPDILVGIQKRVNLLKEIDEIQDKNTKNKPVTQLADFLRKIFYSKRGQREYSVSYELVHGVMQALYEQDDPTLFDQIVHFLTKIESEFFSGAHCAIILDKLALSKEIKQLKQAHVGSETIAELLISLVEYEHTGLWADEDTRKLDGELILLHRDNKTLFNDIMALLETIKTKLDIPMLGNDTMRKTELIEKINCLEGEHCEDADIVQITCLLKALFYPQESQSFYETMKDLKDSMTNLYQKQEASAVFDALAALFLEIDELEFAFGFGFVRFIKTIQLREKIKQFEYTQEQSNTAFTDTARILREMVDPDENSVVTYGSYTDKLRNTLIALKIEVPALFETTMRFVEDIKTELGFGLPAFGASMHENLGLAVKIEQFRRTHQDIAPIHTIAHILMQMIDSVDVQNAYAYNVTNKKALHDSLFAVYQGNKALLDDVIAFLKTIQIHLSLEAIQKVKLRGDIQAFQMQYAEHDSIQTITRILNSVVDSPYARTIYNRDSTDLQNALIDLVAEQDTTLIDEIIVLVIRVETECNLPDFGTRMQKNYQIVQALRQFGVKHSENQDGNKVVAFLLDLLDSVDAKQHYRDCEQRLRALLTAASQQQEMFEDIVRLIAMVEVNLGLPNIGTKIVKALQAIEKIEQLLEANPLLPIIADALKNLINLDESAAVFDSAARKLEHAMVALYQDNPTLFYDVEGLLETTRNELQLPQLGAASMSAVKRKTSLIEKIDQFENEHRGNEHVVKLSGLLKGFFQDDDNIVRGQNVGKLPNCMTALHLKELQQLMDLLSLQKDGVLEDFKALLLQVETALELPNLSVTLEKRVKLIRGIEQFQENWGGSVHASNICGILRSLVAAPEPQIFYDSTKETLRNAINALRWENSSLFNRVVNLVTTVLLALALPILYCTGALAANEKRNGHMFTFFAFGAEQAARAKVLEVVNEMQLTMSAG